MICHKQRLRPLCLTPLFKLVATPSSLANCCCQLLQSKFTPLQTLPFQILYPDKGFFKWYSPFFQIPKLTNDLFFCTTIFLSQFWRLRGIGLNVDNLLKRKTLILEQFCNVLLVDQFRSIHPPIKLTPALIQKDVTCLFGGLVAYSPYPINTCLEDNDKAVSGVQLGARTVTDSTLTIGSVSASNEAKSADGNAISGVENSFGTSFLHRRNIQGTFSGGSSQINLATNSSGNLAVAQDGKAIAGVATNVREIASSSLFQQASATDNKAVVSGSGSVPQTSVAGVNLVTNNVDNANIVLNATSSGNQAFNYHQDPNNASDAVAGVGVVIGAVENSRIILLANSTDNLALATNGNANAGNKGEVLDSDASSIFALDLEASNNMAMTDNGNANIYNTLVIGGQARQIQG